jgi:hypothetical protein
MRKKLFKYSLIALLGTSAAMTSCSKVPQGVLPERKMKDVLIDMQLAENIISSNYQLYADTLRKGALYQSVFKKYQITQAVYDSSLIWYARNPDVLLSLYDMVLNDLNERIRALGDIQAATSPSVNQDSVNIWPRRDYLTFQASEAVFNGTIFEMQPDNEYLPGSTFVLSMQVWGVNERMRHTPEIRISAELMDTTIVINQKITKDGPVEIVLKTPAVKRTRRLYGYIRMDQAETHYYKIYIDKLQLIRYNYGSSALKLRSDSIAID